MFYHLWRQLQRSATLRKSHIARLLIPWDDLELEEAPFARGGLCSLLKT